MTASADENSDDSIVPNSQEKKVRPGKMTYGQEDILISSILKRFDIIENKTTDKSLNQSNKKRATAEWTSIQSEFERQTKVSNENFCLQYSSNCSNKEHHHFVIF